MKLINETRYPAHLLRPIVYRVAKEQMAKGFTNDASHWFSKTMIRARLERLRVTVKYGSTARPDWVGGHAWFFGGPVDLLVSKQGIDRIALAKTMHHEMHHVRGLGHKDMIGNGRLHPKPIFFAWAEGPRIMLPARPDPAIARAAMVKFNAALQLRTAEIAVRNWTRKRRLATTKLKKWTRRLAALKKGAD